MLGMTSLKTIAAAAALAATGWAGAAAASTVEYVGSGQGTTYTIAFDDDTAGQIGVTLTTTGLSADMLGLGMDWGGSALDTDLVTGDFVFVSSSTGEGITDICTNTDSCGGGLNFNGTGLTFDYIVRMGDQGSANGAITDFSFYILTTESLDDILTDSFGIRAQSTGTDGEGSIKLVEFERVAPIPVPAAGLLLLGGLGALGLAKRRRKAA